MMRKKRRCKPFFAAVCIALVAVLCIPAYAAPSESNALTLDCRSALLMEAETGEVLYALNEHEALPPASVTKVMTLLLIMEEIEAGRLSYSDTVTVSENAASMGGSQIFLEAGEQMSVEDLVKSVVIASANDAAVALAEHISGSEGAFVERMNARGAELGMKDTVFENTNGLDDTTDSHLTSAYDIALMSRELIKYTKITEYSSIWMDTVRDGEFGLTNTNRLIRFYKGATGLKTGSTAKAGFCITATAERDGMTLIAVIMGAETRDGRNSSAVKLLDHGFSHYTLYRDTHRELADVKVTRGVKESCALKAQELCAVLEKAAVSRVEKKVICAQEAGAPIEEGMRLGEVIYTLDGEEIGRADVYAAERVGRMTFFEALLRILCGALLKT